MSRSGVPRFPGNQNLVQALGLLSVGTRQECGVRAVHTLPLLWLEYLGDDIMVTVNDEGQTYVTSDSSGELRPPASGTTSLMCRFCNGVPAGPFIWTSCLDLAGPP